MGFGFLWYTTGTLLGTTLVGDGALTSLKTGNLLVVKVAPLVKPALQHAASTATTNAAKTADLVQGISRRVPLLCSLLRCIPFRCFRIPSSIAWRPRRRLASATKTKLFLRPIVPPRRDEFPCTLIPHFRPPAGAKSTTGPNSSDSDAERGKDTVIIRHLGQRGFPEAQMSKGASQCCLLLVQ